MKKLITLAVILIVCGGCPRSAYVGVQTTTKNGKTEVKGKKFKSYSQCQRKSRRMAKRRMRARTHNQSYGITTMGGAKQRQR